MKKVIIFGATGSMGLYVAEFCRMHLDASEYEVVAVGRRATDYFTRYGIKYYQADVTQSDSFSVLPKDDIYAVIDFAGILPAGMLEYRPKLYIDVNVTGAFNILEYCRETGADRFIYAQSYADIGGYIGERKVLSPDLPRKMNYTNDHAFYIISKNMAVDLAEHYHQVYGIRNIIFRLPNVYVYTPAKYYYVDGVKRLISYRYLIDRALRGEPLEIWGNPKKVRDMVYVKDFCQMVCKSLTADVQSVVYNVGTGAGTSLEDQIFGIAEVFCPEGKRSELIYRPDMPNAMEYVMDITNAVQELDYHPAYGYLNYLKDYKEEMNSNRFESFECGDCL